MTHFIEIRQMTGEDVETVYRVFAEHKINKPKEYVMSCWEENVTGERITLLAFYQGGFAGSLHLLSASDYPYFYQNGIPEINDFNVIPPLRKLGIGNALMDAVEQLAFEKYGIVGIGVGLYDSYGSAQRLYAKRGYIPDGRGVMYRLEPVIPGSEVPADDDLNLFFTKVQGGWAKRFEHRAGCP
ncbi:GNAT family N-acetyltransferase [Paenibacillus alkaliterrae]|uniref:GNAT family N-acetyltransferase n=1 Tax=Paenibacillus alkaliterrae TaxID=320909 RepID=UPI001F3594B0|nr:GNAT family N-acetyltransferase [Paenibacillus alkaliterrae]MCF2938818.1 GNAT family N-acetyltransferase [Paenibacillus alkaliterrae]